MPSDIEQQEEDWVVNQADPNASFMQKFKLYETRSNFYMVGRDKNRTFCRVLKIDRLEPTELSILEDPMAYSELECSDLLKRINEGNRPTGGLKFVITCYGIVGFIRFLGPYYMLLITKRRKIGVICGQAIYAITKSKMIPIPNSTVRSQMAYSKNENRYKRLLCTMDLTKDFFFSYSYHVMCSLQKNLSNSKTGQFLYETMFVWNEFLTRGIRSHLNNTLWTVALVYGFFKQVQLSISDRDFRLTLISRRSRHFAGTRYLKRGVNEKGRVANDVETEQIVFEDVPDGRLLQISSVVQIRGSIPLFWSQETSRLNIKPDIILSRKDHNYDATRLHFQNLVKRYGNPIVILNLIKSREKRPRESILRAEFAHAIDVINTDLSEKSRLKFLHWDLHKQTRNKGANVLSLLGKVAAYALKLTGIFYFQVPATLKPDGLLSQPYFRHKNGGVESYRQTLDENNEHSSKFEREVVSGVNDMANCFAKPSYQNGVLRTNCIDCLDRTNVAQYAYGLAALGHQLYSLGFIDVPIVDQDGPLADDLMEIYEMMGDTLALQYGGSAAHNKIFSERRGQWKAATQSQEFFRTLQRYYSNAYMDAEKQDAINLFLGYFQPQQDQPALWELDSDRHYNVGSCVPSFDDESARLLFKRSLSDGNILSENNSTIALANVVKESNCDQPFSGNSNGVNMVLSESTPEMSTCESDLSFSRFTPSMPQRQLFQDAQLNQCLESDRLCSGEHSDDCSCSNFVDVDCLSSSVNSFEDETYERSLSTFINSPIVCLSSEDVINESSSESGTSVKGREQIGTSLSYDTAHHYSDSFADWVTGGELLFH